MSSSRDATPNREKLIELRFENNMTREDIAEHFDVSIATVRRWIKDMDVPRPTRRKRASRPKATKSKPVKARKEDGYNDFERSRVILEGRVVEKKGKGYYLYALPSTAEKIIEEAHKV